MIRFDDGPLTSPACHATKPASVSASKWRWYGPASSVNCNCNCSSVDVRAEGAPRGRVCEAELSYSGRRGGGWPSRGCGACEDGLSNDGARNVSAPVRRAARRQGSCMRGRGRGRTSSRSRVLAVSPNSIELGIIDRAAVVGSLVLEPRTCKTWRRKWGGLGAM